MGQARWVALSDTNLHATLRSHLPLLNLEQARVLSILPWHHAFGLLIDLFPALLSGAEIVRDPDGGRSTDGLIALLQQHQTTHLSGVPITFQRLMERETGRRLLQGLQGGVIGGAPVTGELAQFLATTRLRVGYGQTEASPGITLGEPGQWAAHCMGRPIGCQVYINAQGVLHFAGPNACYGFWEQNGLRTEAPDRWVNTGDIVREADGMLYFAGRYDDQFKLSNGRYVLAGLLETQLKEHLPEVEEALLCCVDGERLRLYISQRPNAAQPEAAQVRACLGALGSYLTQIVSLPQNAWIRTPKGVIDRQEMLRALEHTALAA
jgi:long-subunit acyl-CoA synthetase (AMP-forming)